VREGRKVGRKRKYIRKFKRIKKKRIREKTEK
jgi:hypothetical protein